MPKRRPLRCLLGRGQIRRRVRELAEQIERDYQGCQLVLLGTLKGSFVFLSDLMRRLRLPVEVDFVGVSSYGLGQESSGQVSVYHSPRLELRGRHVLLVEDIVDTGLTAAYLTRLLRARRPASLVICTLLDKRARRIAPNLPLAYVGFEVPDRFVVGYGLDYRQLYRNLPYIGVLRDELLSPGDPP